VEDKEKRQVREEDRTAEFLALLGEHELKLASCIHLLVPFWQDAEDILQETKLRLWRDFSTFQPGTDFPAWARTVARYVIRAHFKSNQRKPLCLSSEVEDLILGDLASAPSRPDIRLETLVDCAKRLSAEAMFLMRRCYIDKRTIKDVAAELGRSLPGTYKAISRIRQQLFECVQDRMREENGR
jgi:RNA polymerase sigma-70 factor, ECF subfamily